MREAIDKTIKPRIADHHLYLARTVESEIPVETTQQLYVYNHHRDQMLDFSALNNPLGHIPFAVTSRIAEQLNHYGHVGAQGEYITRWPVEYAQKLSESLTTDRATKGPKKVFYCSTVEQAQSLALQMAMRRTKSIGGSVTAQTLAFMNNGRPRDPYTVQQEADRIKADGGHIIIDESLLGFGRTGTFWSQERWNIDADITVVGGPAGGGFPFAAVIADSEYFSDEWMLEDQVEEDPFAGHPVICAAGAAVFDAINVGVLAHVEGAAQALHLALLELQVQFPDLIQSGYGAGLYQTIVFRNSEIAERVRNTAIGYGLLLPRPSEDMITITPPLIASENEIKRGVDILAGVCLDTAG